MDLGPVHITLETVIATSVYKVSSLVSLTDVGGVFSLPNNIIIEDLEKSIIRFYNTIIRTKISSNWSGKHAGMTSDHNMDKALIAEQE